MIRCVVCRIVCWWATNLASRGEHRLPACPHQSSGPLIRRLCVLLLVCSDSIAVEFASEKQPNYVFEVVDTAGLKVRSHSQFTSALALHAASNTCN